ncbi:MAG: serine/threonine protein kinase [bacterium]|nr:serine/threonine protein kinase [bacterium]
MNPERWQRLKDVFAQANELDNPVRREAFLDEACAGDRELRREVDSLLAAAATTESLVDRPFVDLHAESETTPAGRRIGPYKVLREIGRGGLGIVYLAVRVEFEQRVALKVIKRGMDTDEVVGRFHRERQILANLEHPAIARLLDGGSTEDGQPYFVMELVDGQRLDRFCESNRLSARARLRLFLKVCLAVEFAHRNLVVHRDIKPANVLVRGEDVKLLDFGIAKLLTPDVPASRPSLTSLAGYVPMTPDYASPEQIRGDAVTTASDVYSLGVVLHELLTGRLPERPTDGGVARFRDIEADLTSIVGKALRQEPEQRYSSVGRLVDDVRHYLAGRPVLAREGAFLYRAGKLVRRHRWRLVAACVVVLAATTGVGMKVESDRELAAAELTRRLAAERAEEAHQQSEIRSELLLNLFTAADLRHDQSFTVRQLLARGEERIRGNLEDERLATQLEILGLLYDDLSDADLARRLLEDALRLRRGIYADDHALVARGLNNLGTWHYHAGEYEAAGTFYRESLDMRRRLGHDGVDLFKLMNNLASARMALGDYVAAEELYRQSLEIRRTVYGDDDASVATGLRSLGTLLYRKGDIDGAVPMLRRAVEIRRHHYGPRDVRVASAESSLARSLHVLGELTQAEELLRSVLDVRRELLGEDHPHTAVTRQDLASVLRDRGKNAEAEALRAAGPLGR